MTKNIEAIAEQLMDNGASFEDFAAIIRSENLTKDQVCEIFDYIEDIVPHATFSNVDRLIALAA